MPGSSVICAAVYLALGLPTIVIPVHIEPVANCIGGEGIGPITGQ